MNRWLAVGFMVAVAMTGCSDGASSESSVRFPMPIIELPQPPSRPSPPDDLTARELDFAAFREIAGEWELVSFTGVDTGPRTLYFDYMRSDETGRTYRITWSGSCRGGGGSYLVSGEQIWIAGSGGMTLEGRACDTDPVLRAQDLAFSYLMAEAETWSVTSDRLTLTTTTDDVAVFARSPASFPDELEVDDDVEVVVPRLHFVDESGFMVVLQEQEDADGLHQAEEVNWVAWESGTTGGWITDHVVSPNSWVWPDMGSPDSFVAVPFDFPSQSACLLADMHSVHGDNPASLRFRETESGIELLVDEEESTSVETGHTDEIIRALVLDCEAPTSFSGVEVGRVEEVTGEWQTVPIAGRYEDPVVVAGPASLNGNDPGVVEIRRSRADAFEIRFAEWDYLDGLHPTGESISFIVAERGTTVLPGGIVVVAGTAAATTTIRSVEYPTEFDETPVLVSTISR